MRAGPDPENAKRGKTMMGEQNLTRRPPKKIVYNPPPPLSSGQETLRVQGGAACSFLVCPSRALNSGERVYRVCTWTRNQAKTLVPNPSQIYAHGLLGLGTGLKGLNTSTKRNFLGSYSDVKTQIWFLFQVNSS